MIDREPHHESTWGAAQANVGDYLTVVLKHKADGRSVPKVREIIRHQEKSTSGDIWT